MSGYSGNLKKGAKVIVDGQLRVVKDWVFLSSPVHNSDEIFITFESGKGHSGLYGIETKEEIEATIKEYNRKLKLFK